MRRQVCLLMTMGSMASLLPTLGASGQETRTGLEVGAVPAINYDSDEGFGYGATGELYHYGARGLQPYPWTLRPTVFLMTGGRRDITLFFDSSHLVPGWRLDVYGGTSSETTAPIYIGLGYLYCREAGGGGSSAPARPPFGVGWRPLSPSTSRTCSPTGGPSPRAVSQRGRRPSPP